jgi:hypothetical protein
MKLIININKFRNKIILKKNDIEFGYVSYCKSNNIIYLSNLYVNNKYRNQGHGAFLTKQVEIINKDYNIFKLCAWDPCCNPYVVDFYENHGYKIDNDNDNYNYDDGVTIYNLVQMTKII